MNLDLVDAIVVVVGVGVGVEVEIEFVSVFRKFNE